MRTQIWILILFGVMMSCKATKNDKVLDTAKNSLAVLDGDGIKCEANESNTHNLCQTDLKQNSEPDAIVKFMVYDQNTNEILLEKSISRGYVKWINDDEIEFLSMPGMMKQGQSTSELIKRYNVKTGSFSGNSMNSSESQ